MAIGVRVIRPLVFRGQHQPTNTVLHVEPFAAYELWASGRAELVDQADAQAVRAAVEQHNTQALKQPGSSRPAWR